MVNIVSRTRKLKQLLWIRCGPGALILPKEVSKIQMEFNTKLYGGHRGARKFWREMLPRMKYRNPSVPMAITRHTDADGPSQLMIWTKDAAAAQQQSPTSTTPAYSSTTSTTPPTHTLNIKDIDESQILDMLLNTLAITPIEASEQEKQELAEMADFREKSERDRVEVREKLLKVRREEELLRLARGEVVETA